jgi:hypothetical protein
MREDEIRSAYPPNCPNADDLLECARRLEPLFPQGINDVETGLILYSVLISVVIVFRDGFILSDDNDHNKIIGNVEARLIVAALDAKGRSERWWWMHDFPRSLSAKEALAAHNALKARMGAMEGVAEVR